MLRARRDRAALPALRAWKMLSFVVALLASWSSALAHGRPLTVYAAASLTEVLQEAGRRFEASTHVPVRLSFASSGVAARQIEAGAKADLFVSADTGWMDYLQARRLIRPATRVDVARGRLVLVAPAARARPVRIARGLPIARMLGPNGRLAVGDPASVPAGRYAEAALRSLGVWRAASTRLAIADNVRGALAFVSRGEAPLGIVYETDARLDPGVRVVGVFPEGSHAPIVYPAAATIAADAGATRFLAYLSGPSGRALFRKFGFRAVR